MALISPFWTDADEQEAYHRVQLRNTVRAASGFLPWWEMLSSDSAEAVDAVKERRLPCINVLQDLPAGRHFADSLVDVLAGILFEREQKLHPWTIAQVDKFHGEEYWYATGPWHLVFSTSEDAVLARLLLSDEDANNFG